jgi:hypothetical protein
MLKCPEFERPFKSRGVLCWGLVHAACTVQVRPHNQSRNQDTGLKSPKQLYGYAATKMDDRHEAQILGRSQAAVQDQVTGLLYWVGRLLWPEGLHEQVIALEGYSS